MTDAIWITLLIVFSVPAYLALSWVHGDSRRRSIHATEELVVTDLILERKERSLEIARQSFQDRLTAVRNCEYRIYGYMPSSDHPEQLKAIVSPQHAQEHLDHMLRTYDGAEQRARELHAELEKHLEEKRVRIRETNRRFLVVDRVLSVSAVVLRLCLVITVLLALTAVLFGPFV
ncbi:hypothetical protein [Nocardiopsis prasina]|uniref:hypothetical protein n=1 Tax=Nocardiopsis prasina TaxID=2015 RepID=UPI00036084E4|nr:hypothetical protein [Nocardiopsis prasina]